MSPLLRSRPLAALLLCAAPLALLPGCAATLQPAAEAEVAPGGGATASTGGVTIVTMTPDFPGMTDIESAVTPVRIKITNNGRAPALIRYSEFTLVSADGTSYPALPLYKIDTTVTTALPYKPILSPTFRWSRFRVAPYYRGLYPGIPTWGGIGRPFGYGRYGWSYYDDVFGGGFANVKLPTPAMYRNALPEGVLDPGGSLEGWLYFKRVTVQKGKISFNAAVTNVSGQSLGTISIPYMFVK